MPVVPGTKYGRWTLIQRTDFTKRAKWLARCECGTEKEVVLDSVIRGLSQSCGCLRAEVMSEIKRTHGKSKSKFYRVWASIKGRCTNPSDPWYPEYGGRGIKLHRAWHRFEAFAKYMGTPPSDAHSVDRINNDKGYRPGNVCWSTSVEQARNRRGNRMITYAGKTQCLSAWAEEYGITRACLQTRLDREGLDIETALTRPSRYSRS